MMTPSSLPSHWCRSARRPAGNDRILADRHGLVGVGQNLKLTKAKQNGCCQQRSVFQMFQCPTSRAAGHLRHDVPESMRSSTVNVRGPNQLRSKILQPRTNCHDRLLPDHYPTTDTRRPQIRRFPCKPPGPQIRTERLQWLHRFFRRDYFDRFNANDHCNWCQRDIPTNRYTPHWQSSYNCARRAKAHGRNSRKGQPKRHRQQSRKIFRDPPGGPGLPDRNDRQCRAVDVDASGPINSVNPIPGFLKGLAQSSSEFLQYGNRHRASKKPVRRTSLITGLNCRLSIKSANSTRRSRFIIWHPGWNRNGSAAFGGCQVFSESGLVSGSFVLMNQVLRRRLVDSLGYLAKQLFLVIKRNLGISERCPEPLNQRAERRPLRPVGEAQFQTLTMSFFSVSCMWHFNKSSLILT